MPMGLPNDEWSGIVNNAFGPPMTMPSATSNSSYKEPAPLTVTESDIFGSERTNNNARNRNWSNFTTESENEPIINLVSTNGKRTRGKSLSEGDMTYLPPPRQKMRKNTGDHQGIPINPGYQDTQLQYLPPMVATMNMKNDPLPPIPKKRGRGRPRKYAAKPNNKVSPDAMKRSKSKYAGLKKAEREKLRRKELKEGYCKLTELLGLNVERAGAALPDRSVIVAGACAEIKRLEQELFRVGMYKVER